MEKVYHVPVLLNEVIESLKINPSGTYVDCTAGGGGHSYEIASRLTTGRLVAIDQDENAIVAAGKRLAPFADRVSLVRENFSNVACVLDNLGIREVDGALIDLGISSHQIDEGERGFSYMQNAPLDMRMDKRNHLSAYNVVNEYSHGELCRIFREYGEEAKFNSAIASAILKQRETMPIVTTGELSELLHKVYPKHIKTGHPAKKVFQAIRIEVNKELDVIRPALDSLVKVLRLGGRLAVITFHSIEDRLVKQAFAEMARECVCPPMLPVCACEKRREVIPIGKSVAPGAKEIEENSRAASARLRIAEKC
ncbi:MAG: 16S rRNA (cytosine(1402)-N(4))-methyltransferase RsmH [Oscillospiraceae bacterium]|nr:16S rRNA (cytosine(1402)-N(4))-methyltransferase RsmH [Oscillospiraceae bacterium]